MRKVIALIPLVLLLAGCATEVAPTTLGDPGAARKVLVAAENTEFKLAVLARVVDSLGTQGWSYRVIGLDALAKQDTSGYGAVVLMGGFRAGHMDKRISSFLAADPMNPRTIIFYTRGTEDPLPASRAPDIRVDAVSSASRDDRVQQRAEELAALIERRF